MKKRNKKKKDKKKTMIEMYQSLPIGTSHFLRNGAGVHKDKKKEESREMCRKGE